MTSRVLYATAVKEVAAVAREVNFMVRLTVQEKELLDLLARRFGESRSVVVRQAIRELARREGVEAPPEEERSE